MQASLTYSRDSITKQMAAGSTLADLATSVNLAYLGAPTENIRFTSGGVELEKTAALYDGMEVYIEPKSHSKAHDDDDDTYPEDYADEETGPGVYITNKYKVEFNRESYVVTKNGNPNELAQRYSEDILSPARLAFLGVPEVAQVKFTHTVSYMANGIVVDSQSTGHLTEVITPSSNVRAVPLFGVDTSEDWEDQRGSNEVYHTIVITRVAHVKA